MILQNVNYIAVIIAALVPMIMGMFWYGPLFGSVWLKLAGFTKKDMENGKDMMYFSYAVSLVGSLVSAYVLAQIFALTDTLTIQEALGTGFLVWLGFIATTKLNDVLWGKKSWALFALDIGYHLATIIVMSLVIIYL